MAYISSNAAAVFGTAGNDTLDIRNGVTQTVYGGLGNDIYYVDFYYRGDGSPDTQADTIVEAANGGIDTVKAWLSTDGTFGNVNTITLANNVENLDMTAYSWVAGDHTFSAAGNALDNVITATRDQYDYGKSHFVLYGAAGNDKLVTSIHSDTLDGGFGKDTMLGGKGDDLYYVDNAGDVVTELADEGFYDRVYASVSYTLTNHVETLYLQNASNINGTGNNLNNNLSGNSGNNILSGMGGNDYLYGGNGNDTLLGGAGNDELAGGIGIDKLDGGAGDDLYYDVEAGDIVADTGIGGNDTVYANEQLIGDLGAGIENLYMGGGNTTGRGNALSNFIQGTSGNNVMFGLAGDDILNGQSGNDILEGGEGNDVLEGGAGDDIMRGGNGNDTYIVDSTSDAVIEIASTGGVDTVYTAVNFALGAFVENITITGPAGRNVYGNTLNNMMIGGAGWDVMLGYGGNDTLNGGIGEDWLYGGEGADVYIVDNTGDFVGEFGGDNAIDTVQSSVVFDLSGWGAGLVENLTLTGTDNINATGNALNNVLTGNDGNNILDGKAGADTMKGGLGSDSYIVDNVGDKIIELANQGEDWVTSTINFSIASLANVEHIELQGGSATALNATGNNSANALYGNEFNNKLDGGAGNDYLYGGNGNDTLLGGAGEDALRGGSGADSLVGGAGNDYYEDYEVGIDTLVELAGGGTDKVFFYGNNIILDMNSAQLQQIENAQMGFGNKGVSGITGNGLNNYLTGSKYSNTLIGNAGNDTLDGGSDADTLRGGMGNDLYFVDDAGDDLQENVGEGIDTVKSSISYTLKVNFENLTLIGSDNITGIGNTQANVMTGNDNDNALFGLEGNDTLFGGLGDDQLWGGAGADSMVGGLGNDYYIVDNVGDKVVELANQGIDGVYSSVSFNLATSGANIENIIAYGATAGVVFIGNALNNGMVGSTFADKLDGGAGDDRLYAGAGGSDTLIGGAGSDTFVFGSSSVNALVTDFVLGLDKVGLSMGVLTFTGAGNSLTASMFKLGTTATDGDDYILYDQATGQLYYDSDANGMAAKVLIGDFANGLALSSTDFFYG